MQCFALPLAKLCVATCKALRELTQYNATFNPHMSSRKEITKNYLNERGLDSPAGGLPSHCINDKNICNSDITSPRHPCYSDQRLNFFESASIPPSSGVVSTLLFTSSNVPPVVAACNNVSAAPAKTITSGIIYSFFIISFHYFVTTFFIVPSAIRTMFTPLIILL